MLKLTCADGKTLYPGAKHKAGSWQETVELSALLLDVEVKGAELVLGLENCAGQVAFDTDSLVLEDCGSPFERVNRTHQAAYTPSVLSRPRRRGVMSPMRLEKLTEADFVTLKQWGANLMRYQISKDWKSPSAWLDLDEYDRYVDEMLDILDRRVLPWAVARGGRRLKRKCGIPPSDKCVLRNILFENIVGSSRSSIANSITGVEGCRVKDVTLRNVHLRCRGAGAELSRTARTQTVRERAGAYPECNMFDFQILPAYSLYARHVDGLVLENVTDELQDGTEDLRDRIVLDDVTGYRGPSRR